MTVADLIARLSTCNPDTPVVILGGYPPDGYDGGRDEFEVLSVEEADIPVVCEHARLWHYQDQCKCEPGMRHVVTISDETP